MSVKVTLPAALLCAASLCTPALASPLCVKASEANLRQGPGTQYEKSWKVYQYMPLDKIGQRGKWYKVRDLDGDSHWIYNGLVSKSLRCAVVKATEANVRRGPGTGYAKSELSPVEKYYSFKVIATEGRWVRVEDEIVNEGWIARSLLWMP